MVETNGCRVGCRVRSSFALLESDAFVDANGCVEVLSCEAAVRFDCRDGIVDEVGASRCQLHWERAAASSRQKTGRQWQAGAECKYFAGARSAPRWTMEFDSAPSGMLDARQWPKYLLFKWLKISSALIFSSGSPSFLLRRLVHLPPSPSVFVLRT